MTKTCAFITLGCKVNQYDTQILGEALAQELALGYKRNFLGKEIGILVEESPSPGTYSGYSERYIKAHFSGPEGLMGKIVKVRMEEVSPEYVRVSWRVDSRE